MEKAEEKEVRTPQGKAASEVLQTFLKAKKNLRLYPQNNPIYMKTVEMAFYKVQEYFALADKLDLKISRSDIHMGGELVYHNESKDDNLALFFFRDGLRTITITNGLELEELRDLLNILSYDLDSEDVEEDLITLLWEKDFQHVKYTVDENVLVEDDGYQQEAEREAKEGASEEDSIQQAYADTFKEPDPEAVQYMPITETDLMALMAMIEKDSQTKLPKLVDILFDMLYAAESDDEFQDVIKIMNNAIEFSLREGDLNAAFSIPRRIKPIIEKTQADNIKRSLRLVLNYFSSPAVVRLVGLHMEEKGGLDQELFTEFVSFLGPASIQALIGLLGELQNPTARKLIIVALAEVGKKDMGSLAKALQDKRWYVVRNVLLVFRQIKDKKAVDYLIKMGRHEDPRVTKELIKAIGELGGDESIAALLLYLSDPDPAIRFAAIKAISDIGTQTAKVVILERVLDKKLINLEFTEIKEYFGALARWRHRDVFDVLKGITDKDPFFGRAKYNNYKAGALYAMGIIGGKECLTELEKYRESKVQILKEQAQQGISRMRYAGRQTKQEKPDG